MCLQIVGESGSGVFCLKETEGPRDHSCEHEPFMADIPSASRERGFSPSDPPVITKAKKTNKIKDGVRLCHSAFQGNEYPHCLPG